MITIISKYKRVMKCAAIVLTSALFASCSDWDDHYAGSSVEGSNTTLWQAISSRPELSDFAEVLQNTMVFRQHKKTAASYAEILDGGQSFTVMAPVNGTFNKEALIQLAQTNHGDSAVEHFFVKNHVARTPISATERNFRMLNNKKVVMDEESVWGIKFKDKNIRSKNGILHIMTDSLPYNRTIYEVLTQTSDFESVGKAIMHYTEDVFDENASLSSGLVEGVPVYVDSVVYENNKLINAIGQLNAQDSTYYTAVPTEEGWNKAWEKASTYFVYPSNLEKNDSVQHYWTLRSLLEDGIFSRTVQSNMQDSIISVQYNRATPEYHVFYKPFAEGGLFKRANGTVDACNGILYKYNEWPFKPTETYFKKIEVEAEETWRIISTKDIASYDVKEVNADSISRNKYLEISGSGTKNWEMTFKFANTLSGKYDICLVLQPQTVADPSITKPKSNKFEAVLNYVDLDGKVVNQSLGKSFTNDKFCTDTIVVAKAFQFPTCNFDQNNDNISLTIKCNVSSKETSYVRKMYLDIIYLKPVEDE